MKPIILLSTLFWALPATAKPPAAAAGRVVKTSEAPVFVAPSGKAEIQHLAKGFQAYVGRLTLAPNAAVPEHQDTSEEHIYVLEGHGTLTMNGQKYQVGPGTLIYMPALAKVSYQNGDQRFVGLQVFAGPGSAKKYEKWAVKPTK